MVHRRAPSPGRVVAAAVAVAVLAGLGLLVAPGGAGATPDLPPVTPDELVSAVQGARHGAFHGTVELDNELGLPTLPGAPQVADGTSLARIWSDGRSGDRIQLPTDGGERTLVTDGTTFWAWNSQDRSVVTGKRDGAPDRPEADSDPSTAAKELIARLRSSSNLAVDGTVSVADRPAYELVLTPKPTERTLLREVRIAVDAETRMPLRLTVLGNGSPDPALQVGFTELSFGAQDPALFTFTPPPGATVRQRPETPQGSSANNPNRSVVGEGWDAVVITKRRPPRPGEPVVDLSAAGRPISGSWGSGRLLGSAVGNAIVTDDGRVAAGAVPEQILDEALGT